MPARAQLWEHSASIVKENAGISFQEGAKEARFASTFHFGKLSTTLLYSLTGVKHTPVLDVFQKYQGAYKNSIKNMRARRILREKALIIIRG